MNIQEIIELYEEGRSMAFLANKYGTTAYKIKKILLENGITIRTRAEQNRITNQEKGKKVNHNFFDIINSNEKAWLLGFFAADGTVHKDRNLMKIGLSSVDREILEKIKLLIESERDILDYTSNQGFNISELAWSSERQKERLANFDIVPNKTYKKMNLPFFDGDKEKQLSFIMGYFDGDGCFKNDGTTCRFEICSHLPYILNDFAIFLNELTNSKIEVKEGISRPGYFTITYSTKACEKILNEFYNNPNNTLFLTRKFDKYNLWKQQNNRI